MSIHELIKIRLAHCKYGIRRVRWSDLPAEAPLTWYHLCEFLERKYLLVSAHRSFSSVDSAFVAIYESQFKQFEQERQETKPFVLLSWLTIHCISPFTVFETRDCSFVLFRLTRSERLALFNHRFGPKWVYKIQYLYRDYEQEEKPSTMITNTRDSPQLNEKKEDDDDDESQIARFIDETDNSNNTKHPITNNAPIQYRTSYVIDHIGIQKQRDKRQEQTKGVATNLYIESTNTHLLCKRIIPNVPFGVLKRDLLELNEKNYHLYFANIDFSQILVYQETETEDTIITVPKQYVLQRDIGYKAASKTMDEDVQGRCLHSVRHTGL